MGCSNKSANSLGLVTVRAKPNSEMNTTVESLSHLSTGDERRPRRVVLSVLSDELSTMVWFRLWLVSGMVVLSFGFFGLCAAAVADSSKG